MKTLNICILFALPMIVAGSGGFAQCHSSQMASVPAVNFSHPSNGSVTRCASPAANTSFNYNSIARPATTTLHIPPSANTFNRYIQSVIPHKFNAEPGRLLIEINS